VSQWFDTRPETEHELKLAQSHIAHTHAPPQAVSDKPPPRASSPTSPAALLSKPARRPRGPAPSLHKTAIAVAAAAVAAAAAVRGATDARDTATRAAAWEGARAAELKEQLQASAARIEALEAVAAKLRSQIDDGESREQATRLELKRVLTARKKPLVPGGFGRGPVTVAPQPWYLATTGGVTYRDYREMTGPMEGEPQSGRRGRRYDAGVGLAAEVREAQQQKHQPVSPKAQEPPTESASTSSDPAPAAPSVSEAVTAPEESPNDRGEYAPEHGAASANKNSYIIVIDEPAVIAEVAAVASD